MFESIDETYYLANDDPEGPESELNFDDDDVWVGPYSDEEDEE